MAMCINTRVHIDKCIFFACPYGHVFMLHTAIWPCGIWPHGRLWPRVILTRGQLFLIKYILKKNYNYYGFVFVFMHNNITVYMHNDSFCTLCI
jgi:hypothetical protein